MALNGMNSWQWRKVYTLQIRQSNMQKQCIKRISKTLWYAFFRSGLFNYVHAATFWSYNRPLSYSLMEYSFFSRFSLIYCFFYFFLVSLWFIVFLALSSVGLTEGVYILLSVSKKTDLMMKMMIRKLASNERRVDENANRLFKLPGTDIFI